MKGAVVTAVVSVLLVAGAIGGAAAWRAWTGGGRPAGALSDADVAWLRTFSAAPCRENPSSAPRRFVAAVRLAHRACFEPRAASDRDFHAVWSDLHAQLLEAKPLPMQGGFSERSRVEPRLGPIASRIAGRQIAVRCWSDRDWDFVVREWQALSRRAEFWPVGLADRFEGAADIAPSACAPLARFYYGSYAPSGTTASLELAVALVVLAHEAEHFHRPGASEAVVECHAMQDVRGLVVARGRSARYAGYLAALAWQVAYPRHTAAYRTRACHNGGPLDQRPHDPRWP